MANPPVPKSDQDFDHYHAVIPVKSLNRGQYHNFIHVYGTIRRINLIIRLNKRFFQRGTSLISNHTEDTVLQKLFLDYPWWADETYLQHFAFAVLFSIRLFGPAFAALVHALLPCAFEKTASKTVHGLYSKPTIAGHKKCEPRSHGCRVAVQLIRAICREE